MKCVGGGGEGGAGQASQAGGKGLGRAGKGAWPGLFTEVCGGWGGWGGVWLRVRVQGQGLLGTEDLARAKAVTDQLVRVVPSYTRRCRGGRRRGGLKLSANKRQKVESETSGVWSAASAV